MRRRCRLAKIRTEAAWSVQPILLIQSRLQRAFAGQDSTALGVAAKTASLSDAVQADPFARDEATAALSGLVEKNAAHDASALKSVEDSNGWFGNPMAEV